MKNRDTITLKEMTLIELLDERTQSQRNLARVSGFSLGMTNLLLKRLVGKGYIKVTTLNGRTLRYMLTPKGFSEKLKRSYGYLIHSIRSLNQLKSRIQEAIPGIDPEVPLFVHGNNELALLAKDALKERGIHAEILDTEQVERLSEFESGLILNCEVDPVADEVFSNTKLKVIHLSNLIP